MKAKLAYGDPQRGWDEKGRGGGGGGNPKFILNSVKSILKYQIRKVTHQNIHFDAHYDISRTIFKKS